MTEETAAWWNLSSKPRAADNTTNYYRLCCVIFQIPQLLYFGNQRDLLTSSARPELTMNAPSQGDCVMSGREFSELQNALENVVIELRVANDARGRRELLHRMLQLIVEADTILREKPLTKSARAGASD